MSARTPARIAILALACSGALAALALLAASWTGAAIMMSVAIQALVASSHQAIMLRGAFSRDGHGRAETTADTIFQSYVLAIALYALGAGATLSQSLTALRDTHTVVSPTIAVMALALGLGLSGAAIVVTLALVHSDDASQRTPAFPKPPQVRAILIEHAGAIAGLLIAALGTAFLALLDVPVADASAAAATGLVMVLIAAVMTLEVRKALAAAPANDTSGASPHEDASGHPEIHAILDQPAPAFENARAPALSDATHLSRKDKKRMKRRL